MMTIIIGLIISALIAVIYIGAFDAVIEGVKGPMMPWLVLALAIGLAAVVIVWGVARTAALQ